jgi:colanic acid/amylovoran biosynthesis glycosyltransferase
MTSGISSSQRPKLRVGYVLKRFPRFSETFILNELLELERQGVEVEVFSMLRPPEEPRHARLADLKARVTYLPTVPAPDMLTVKQVAHGGALQKMPLEQAASGSAFEDVMPRRSAAETTAITFKASALALLARAAGVTHLHAHFGSDATTVALLAGRLARLPYSFTAHAKDIYDTYIDEVTDRRMRRAKIAEAAFVATVSEFNRVHLCEIAGRDHTGKIHRLYNGIDLERFSQTGETREKALVLSVGRLVEKKGLGDLVEACRILQARGLQFKCMIVGDGPLREALENQIAQAGLEGCVELAGPRPQEELAALLSRATLFALPCIVTPSGDRDGLPTVLLEALAAGLPSISTNVAGIPEIIDHGKSGLLVGQKDPVQLAGAIESLLTSPSLCARISLAGRQKAERDFDVVKNVAALAACFKRHASSGTEKIMGESDEHRVRVS